MSEITVEEQIAAKFAGLPAPEAPAEEVTAETAEPEAPTEEAPVVEGQARDEQGRFAPPAEEPVVEEKLYAGKYKSDAELERAYLELQSLSGRHGQELSELRKLVEQRIPEQPVQQQQPSYDPGSIDEFLDANPQQIPALAQQAIDSNDGYLYNRALAKWAELDSTGAMDFHAQKVTDAKIAELEARIAPALAVTQQVTTTNQFTEAFQAAKQSLPDDFDTVLNAISPETASAMSVVVEMLKTGDQASKQSALETLYWSEKGRQAGNLTQAAQNAAAETAEQGRAAKQEATVASTTASQDREPVSGVDQWREQFAATAKQLGRMS